MFFANVDWNRTMKSTLMRPTPLRTLSTQRIHPSQAQFIGKRIVRWHGKVLNRRTTGYQVAMVPRARPRHCSSVKSVSCVLYKYVNGRAHGFVVHEVYQVVSTACLCYYTNSTPLLETAYYSVCRHHFNILRACLNFNSPSCFVKILAFCSYVKMYFSTTDFDQMLTVLTIQTSMFRSMVLPTAVRKAHRTSVVFM